MQSIILFIVNSVLLGVGLAMDAFSVSLANGLNNPNMKKKTLFAVASVFAVFQFAMPMIGWFLVHTIAETFVKVQPFIPWIAFILLGFIGGKMIVEGFKGEEEEKKDSSINFKSLMVQGVATSIDALSVGFTIANYNFIKALISTLIIGVVTFGICVIGLLIGKKFGTKIASGASVFGGVILVGIGLEILISSFL